MSGIVIFLLIFGGFIALYFATVALFAWLATR